MNNFEEEEPESFNTPQFHRYYNPKMFTRRNASNLVGQINLKTLMIHYPAGLELTGRCVELLWIRVQTSRVVIIMNCMILKKIDRMGQAAYNHRYIDFIRQIIEEFNSVEGLWHLCHIASDNTYLLNITGRLCCDTLNCAAVMKVVFPDDNISHGIRLMVSYCNHTTPLMLCRNNLPVPMLNCSWRKENPDCGFDSRSAIVLLQYTGRDLKDACWEAPIRHDSRTFWYTCHNTASHEGEQHQENSREFTSCQAGDATSPHR
jgi:hypothetical protein